MKVFLGIMVVLLFAGLYQEKDTPKVMVYATSIIATIIAMLCLTVY